MRKFLFLFLLISTFFSCTQETSDSGTDHTTKADSDKEQMAEDAQDEQNTTSMVKSEKSEDSEVAEMENAAAPDEFQDMNWDEYQESMTQDFSFVIVISTKSYDAALKRAKEASEKLGYPLDLRGLHANEEIGLSFSKEVCENEICGGGLNYPIYIPRSDWGDEKYVSIEYSDAFNGFTKGYYIVVVASGEKGTQKVKEALTEAKKFYKDAYAKTCGVYMGCGC